MAESKTKREKAEEGVLASLPATRPSRLSRRARNGSDGDGAPAKATATAPRKAGPKATAKAPAKAKAAAAKPAAGAGPKPVTEAPKPTRPRPVRAVAPNLSESAAKADSNRDELIEEESRSPSGTELVTTVVKATGELAQIGATVAGQLVKRAVDKLPRR